MKPQGTTQEFSVVRCVSPSPFFVFGCLSSIGPHLHDVSCIVLSSSARCLHISVCLSARCACFEYDCDLDSVLPLLPLGLDKKSGLTALHMHASREYDVCFSCQTHALILGFGCASLWFSCSLGSGPKIRFEQDSETFCLVSFGFLGSFLAPPPPLSSMSCLPDFEAHGSSTWFKHKA